MDTEFDGSILGCINMSGPPPSFYSSLLQSAQLTNEYETVTLSQIVFRQCREPSGENNT